MPQFVYYFNGLQYQTTHAFRCAIGPRRTAVFIGQVPSCIFMTQANFPQEGNLRPPNIRLATCLSYENGCSPRCNLTHNRVPRLVWWSA